MQPFTTLRSPALPLIRDNIDTDLIIPSREMKLVDKTGLADGLFAGWRYKDIGSREINPDFVLNDPAYREARIMLAGANFGCGSSREHAVWALAEYGFRAIIAPSFSPIFRNNCIGNAILPIELDPVPVAAAGGIVEIDLPAQTVRAGSATWRFAIGGEDKAMLVGGHDVIELTLRLGGDIASFRDADRSRRPWAYRPVRR